VSIGYLEFHVTRLITIFRIKHRDFRGPGRLVRINVKSRAKLIFPIARTWQRTYVRTYVCPQLPIIPANYTSGFKIASCDCGFNKHAGYSARVNALCAYGDALFKTFRVA